MKRYLPSACLSLWRHYISLIHTAVKVTTWGLGIKKNSQCGLRLTISCRLYFGLSWNISILINMFQFFCSYLCFISCKRFYVSLIFKYIFFGPWSDPWSNPWSEPWSDPWSGLWFDPVRSKFCWRRKKKCYGKPRYLYFTSIIPEVESTLV